MKVCIISFSSRTAGNCAMIAEYIKEFYGDMPEKYCFSDFSITPCGRCDYDCFAHDCSCPWADDMEHTLLESVAASNLAYFIVPNYCDNPCANYFAFCERGQYYFSKNHDRMKSYETTIKKFIVVSNTEQDNFAKIFSKQVDSIPDILFLRAKDFKKRSIVGDLLSSEEAKQKITWFLEGNATNNHKGGL